MRKQTATSNNSFIIFHWGQNSVNKDNEKCSVIHNCIHQLKKKKKGLFWALSNMRERTETY